MSCLSSVSRFVSGAASFFNPRRAAATIGCSAGAALGAGVFQVACVGALCLMTLSSAYNLWTERKPLPEVAFTAFPIERGFSAELADTCGKELRIVQEEFIRSLFGTLPYSICRQLHKTFWIPGVMRCVESWADPSGCFYSQTRCGEWVREKTGFRPGVHLDSNRLKQGAKVESLDENNRSTIYEVVSDPKAGDIVLYFFQPNDGQKIDFTHIGIVSHTTVDETWVQSKWGTLDVFEHLESAVPREYGNAVVYLRARTWPFETVVRIQRLFNPGGCCMQGIWVRRG